MKNKKIHVIYDYQAFDMQIIGGITRYFCEIIRRLSVNTDISVKYTENYYLIHWKIGKHRTFFRRWIFKHTKHKSEYIERNKLFTKSILVHKQKYLFHPTYYNPYFLQFIGNNPFVITVHDMIHELFPDLFKDANIISQQKKEILTRANHIIAISNNTKNDIIRILNIPPSKIDVIYHSTSMKRHYGEHKLKVPNKYLLFVGDRSPYKNFNLLLKVFSKLSKDFNDLHLLCTGHSFSHQEEEIISQLQISKRILQIKASENELSELYSRAEVFIFPSLYEGFGIPILEAFACECPVALSNTSCFPEIAGNAAIYFDPYSENSMVQSLKEIINNKEMQKQLTVAGLKQLQLYSWDKAAKQTEEVYNKAILHKNNGSS